MGVTIHFRGQLNDKFQVHELMQEVQDICDSMNWEYDLIDEDWSIKPELRIRHYRDTGLELSGHAGLKGIFFKPHPNCSVIPLTFNRAGILVDFLSLIAGYEDDEEDLPWVFTKTQYAGPETHVAIINFLRYIKKKYISNLEVEDEGEYWTTGDVSIVTNRIRKLESALDIIEAGISEMKVEDLTKLSEDELFLKIQGIVKEFDIDDFDQNIDKIDQILRKMGIEFEFDEYNLEDFFEEDDEADDYEDDDDLDMPF